MLEFADEAISDQVPVFLQSIEVKIFLQVVVTVFLQVEVAVCFCPSEISERFDARNIEGQEALPKGVYQI